MLIQPTIEALRQSFHLDISSGELFWCERPIHHFCSPDYARRWNDRWAGVSALSSDNGRGYLAGTLSFYKHEFRLQRHCVNFAISNGVWAKNHVDHKDGDSLNNRPRNLRDASNSVNSRNCRRSKANTSGTTGVYWFKPRNCWTASIGVNGRSKSLGYFRNKNNAIAARKTAEVRFGYSERHGVAP